jgi:N-acetylglucosamine-6-phosphate deacetylase
VTQVIIHTARKLDARGEVDNQWVAIDDDRITATGTGVGWRELARADATVYDAARNWLTPGFIDLHCHGAGGFSFDGGAEAIASALAVHRAHGTTRSTLSLVAAPVDELRESLATIADVAERDPLVLGSHLEGPFMSPDNRGAHDPAFLIEPDPETVELLIAAGRGHLRQLTIAPELPNALESIGVLIEAGVIVAVGHTVADYEQTRAAFATGARMLTHAFNAMPGIHHRKPGPLVAAIENDAITLELIADGMHVHPSVMNLAFTEAPGRIALITDAMAAAGSADGDYRLGTLDVTVHDGLATLTGTGTIAGSTLLQDRAFKVMVEQAGQAPRTVVEALTATPAKAFGLDHELGYIEPGYLADIVLLDHAFEVQAVWANGARLS